MKTANQPINSSLKRGFTIVELAIVLVVIGIILAMAVKGKALVDAAKFRAEINKIRKLEAAMHIYIASNATSHPDGATQWGEVAMQFFYDKGILSPGELRVDGAAAKMNTSMGQLRWTPVQCEVMVQGDYRIFRYIQSFTPASDRSYCAALVSEDIQTGSFDHAPILPKYQCGIELMLDDENVTTGSARRVSSIGGAINPTNFTPEEYKNCMDMPEGILVPWADDMTYRVY
jgi:prepilin-type N-terminal cleavage/methylation domain-containing protein